MKVQLLLRIVVSILTVVGFAPALQADDNVAKPWHGAVDLSMGSQDVQVGGRCLRISAAIVDSSLAKLQKKRSANAMELHRGRTVVDRFPEEVMVEVTVTDCAAPYAVVLGDDGPLQFSAAWSRGSSERSCEVYVPRPRPGTLKTSDTFRVYDLSVSSADVPLTDHLLLNVFSDGKRLAQFVTEL